MQSGEMNELKLCANLSFLFKEVSFLDRYGAAARAGTEIL